MTLPIERFKDSYQNHRRNPFTDTDMAVDKVEDGLIIPSGSPFVIQLLEQARYNDPTSVAVRCYGVDTFVDETSGSGQPILKVDDTTGFSGGDTIIINRGGAREEERIIDSVQVGVSLTVTVNLEFEHTAAQADVVEKYIAFTETAGAPTQSQYRVDYPVGDGGEGTGLVEFNTNDASKEVRISYKATGSPALAETLDTKLSYPAGVPDDNQIVGFSSGVPFWKDFSHEDLVGVSADQHHNEAHTLASHSSKAHSELTGIGTGDHHAQNHASRHHSGGADPIAFANIAGFGDYINQAVKTSSTPNFNNLGLGGAGDGTLTGGDNLHLEAADEVCSETIYGDTTATSANMYIFFDEPNTKYPIHRTTSARKYKTNIKNLELDSSLIYDLRPVSFNSKSKADDKNRRFIGLIADEVEKIFPEIAMYCRDKEVESYDNQMLMTLMLAEIQKLNQRVNQLKN